MKSFVSKTVSAVVLMLALLPQSQAGSLPAMSRAVDRDRIVAVYAGRTWTWKDGRSGLYFARDGRVVAYLIDSKATSGAGNWSVDARGRLCVNVRWQADARRGRSASCWNHRSVGGVVWKQNTRRGRWYSTIGVSREASRVRVGNLLVAKSTDDRR